MRSNPEKQLPSNQMNFRMSHQSLRSAPTIAAGFVFLALPVFGQANNAFFGASRTISGDSDVFTAGSTVWALQSSTVTQAQAPVLLNGVEFLPSNTMRESGGNAAAYWGPGTPSAGSNQMAFTSVTGSFQETGSSFASGSGTGSFASLSPNYKIVLDHAIVAGNTGTVTLSGLTAERAYVLQAWANGSEGTAQNNTKWFIGADDVSNPQRTLLAINGSAAVGGLGQHFLSSFTAGGPTATFNVACSNAIRINALQIRDVTGYWLGNVSGSWSADAANFMGGMTFNNAAISNGGFVAFTDLGGFEGTEPSGTGGTRTIALNRNILIQSAGVAIANIRFENMADTFTFSNASGNTGITGATNLLQTGTGTVVLNGVNTYTGTTTVKAGILKVNGTTGTGEVNIEQNGRLEGNGTIRGLAVIEGSLNPGNSPGILTFEDDLVLASTANTTMEILGLNRGVDYDGINVLGELTYGGALLLDVGTTFEINGVHILNLFEFASQKSSFDSISLGGQYGGALTNDGMGVWTTTTTQGGLSQVWSFSQSNGDLTITVVPEPSVVLLGVFGPMLLLRRKRPA